VRSHDAHARVNAGTGWMPVPGGSPDALTPGALGDPDGIVLRYTVCGRRAIERRAADRHGRLTDGFTVVGDRPFNVASGGVALRGHAAPASDCLTPSCLDRAQTVAAVGASADVVRRYVIQMTRFPCHGDGTRGILPWFRSRIAEVALKSSANQTAVSLTNWMTAANVHYPVGQ
jgi:hypothetical protein